MQINVKIENLEQVLAQVRNAAKQVNYAASRALNNTAFDINDKIKTEMRSRFAGGATAYTLRAFEVKKSDKDNLQATVALRSDTPEGGGTNYQSALAHQFTGGTRRHKKLEGWLRGRGLVPSGMSIVPGAGMGLDRYGNMRPAGLAEMLGVLGNQRTNLLVYRRSGRGKAQKAVGYFIVKPGDHSRLHPGIYKRLQSGSSSAVKPMILFIGTPGYRRAIDFPALGREVAQRVLQPHFDIEWAKARKSAR